jgi:glycosyltransferase involved in cell wall biosynthesis
MKKNKPKKIAMVVFSNYPEDPRVRREAEALQDEGYEIDVFCLKREGQTRKETFGSITAYRSAMSRSRSGKLNYIMEYVSFIMVMMFKVFVHFIGKHYSIVHVHNMPDILVFSALFPKIFGAKVVLDLHDPMPELFMTKYEIGESHRMIKIMKRLEKMSIRFAHKVLTPNLAFKEIFVERGCPEDKIQIIMNSPHEGIFGYCNDKPAGSKDTFSIIYHGSIVERHGLYDALEAVKLLRDKIPAIEFHMYGEGDYKEQLVKDIDDLGLKGVAYFHGFCKQEDLVPEICKSDLGIIPNRRSPFTEVNLPTRIFEYLCLNVPVIVPRTKGILDYFDKDSLLYFNAQDADDLAKVIYEVYKDSNSCKETLQRGIDIYRNYTWAQQKEDLVETVNRLISA